MAWKLPPNTFVTASGGGEHLMKQFNFVKKIHLTFVFFLLIDYFYGGNGRSVDMNVNISIHPIPCLKLGMNSYSVIAIVSAFVTYLTWAVIGWQQLMSDKMKLKLMDKIRLPGIFGRWIVSHCSLFMSHTVHRFNICKYFRLSPISNIDILTILRWFPTWCCFILCTVVVYVRVATKGSRHLFPNLNWKHL